MWNFIVEHFPSFSQWMYTFLSFIVPFIVYKVNLKFHETMDPPWKKEEQENQKQPSN